MLVEPRDLGIANARVQAGMLTGGQLVGPAVGAVLFAAGRAWPFLAQAVLVKFCDRRVHYFGWPEGGQ